MASTTLPPGHRAAFVAVASTLTGFDTTDLEATGLVDQYAALVLTILDASGNGDQYVNVIASLAATPSPAKAFPNALADSFAGPLLQNIVSLWYLGQWLRLPSSWYVNGVQPAIDTNTIPSPFAYGQAFAWRIAGAHPPGSRPTGYGGWGQPPAFTLATDGVAP